MLKKNNNNYFSSVFKKSPVAMLIFELNQNSKLILKDFNNAATKMQKNGASLELGITIEETFPCVEEKEKLQLLNDIASKNLKPQDFEQDYNYENSVGWFKFRIFNIDLNMICIEVIDISKRKTIEEKIKISAEKFEALYENAPLPYQSLNEDGSFRDINRTWLKTLGFNRDEVIGKYYKDFLQPEWKSHYERNFPKLKKRGYINDVQYKIRHKDGHYIDISLDGCIGYNPDGSVRQTYCVFTDITAKKKIEQKLLESEELLNKTSQLSKIGGWKIDYETGQSSWTEESFKAFEIPNDQKAPNLIKSSVFYTEESEKIINKTFKSIEKTEKQFDIEIEIITANNNNRWLRIIGEANKKDDKIVSISGTIQNITEKRNIELALKKSEEQLHHRQKMDAIGQLAGGIAHDFNNSLAGILGVTELMKRNKLDHIKQKKYLDMIITSAERASELTKNLLIFSKKRETSTTSLDMLKIVTQTKDLLVHTFDKNISISIINNSIRSSIIGDESILQNALMNLAINSSHAMPNGGSIEFKLSNITFNRVDCKVATFKLEPGEYLKIDIRDSGSGMSTEILYHIFEPFFTTKKKGTGIGLATVYGAIMNHKGAIDVYSEEGNGTVFHLYFPITPEKTEYILDKEIVKGKGNILVIDDEEILRLTTKDLLESLGYNAICAENGKIGIDIFTKNIENIDLIILDMIMPVMGGRETAEKLRLLDDNIPILISSGFTKESDMEKLNKIGVTGFIHKPYHLADLAESVAKIMPKKF